MIQNVIWKDVYCNKYDNLCDKEKCKVDIEMIKRMAPKNIPNIKI